ncbi:TetR/AcrR family transcriptional regulator [Glutamicibacter halophytocola]|uniref:TetR/AcrR family transcriptional regulator n=1 Tax=Glutamicibacter halophytocola TaxID=1933880 RepID=UPI00321B5E0B
MIINSAERLLAESATGDISTRAVCEAAGVTQPVLYRHFGDKDGLLAAVADHVWENYLSAKRSTKNSDDALEDLRRGWDNHTAFALENPHAYRLVFGTALAARPAAMGGGHEAPGWHHLAARRRGQAVAGAGTGGAGDHGGQQRVGPRADPARRR